MKNNYRFLYLSVISGLISLVPLSRVNANSFYPLLQLAQSAGQEVRSFFETGRLSSEDRIMFTSPPRGVMSPRENSRSWQFIIFKEGGISFWMPPGALTDESVMLNTKLGDLSFRTLSSNSEDRRFVVAYAHSLTEEQIRQPEAILSAIQNKVAPEAQFKLTDTQMIKLNEFPGIEFSYEGIKGIDEAIIVRAYLVNQKVYVLGVRYPTEKPEERQTRSFLNALQLLPTP